MKDKVRQLKPVLFVVAITLMVILSTLAVQTSVKAAEPRVAAGYAHTVGLKSDGTVVAVGRNAYGQLNVNSWTDIIQVAAGAEHTVGLKSDGTVVGIGWNNYGQLNVGNWTNITQIATGGWHTVGLKSDGTVVAVGKHSVVNWTGIVQVAAGYELSLGLKTDGTVVAAGRDSNGELDVGNWTDLTQVAGGDSNTVGLKSDSSVVTAGANSYGQFDAASWTDMIQVAAGHIHIVGLESDGTVVAVGGNYQGQLNVGNWTDIIQVATLWNFTVGLKSDGTVVAVGDISAGQCDVSGWNLMVTPEPSTIHVPADQPTIQAGIDAAWDGDTVLVADGTYTGEGNKNLDFGGKAITVKSGNGPDSCILDGEGSGRGVYFHSNEGPDSVLEGFTITNFVWRGILIFACDPGDNCRCNPTIINCKIIGNTTTASDPVYPRSHGAGILISTQGPAHSPGASPTIKNCTIRNNFGAGESGGGIFSYQSSPTIQNCDVSFNEAVWAGGGIGHYTGDLVVTNCTIVGNTSTHGEAHSGGISIDHYWGGLGAVVTNCVIAENVPGNVYINRGTADITYSNIGGGWTGEGNIDSAPLFINVPNGDHNLSFLSPCIDMGTNSDPNLPNTDINGNPRVVDGDKDATATVDMGAYEFFPIPPPGTILFQDNFDDGNLDGWTPIPDSFNNTNGTWSTVDVGGNVVLQFDVDPNLDAGFLKLNDFGLPASFVLEFDAVTLANDNAGHTYIAAYMHFFDHDNHLVGGFRQGLGLDHLILIEEIGGVRFPGPDHPNKLVFLPFSEDEFEWHHHKYVKDGNRVSFYFDALLS